MNKTISFAGENLNEVTLALSAFLRQNVDIVAISHASHTKQGHPDTYTLIVIYRENKKI